MDYQHLLQSAAAAGTFATSPVTNGATTCATTTHAAAHAVHAAHAAAAHAAARAAVTRFPITYDAVPRYFLYRTHPPEGRD